MEIGQLYHWISIACYVLSGLMFALTVFLFFQYEILNAINILSGRKLKKDMARLSHLAGYADGDMGELKGSSVTEALTDTGTGGTSLFGKSRKRAYQNTETSPLTTTTGSGTRGDDSTVVLACQGTEILSKQYDSDYDENEDIDVFVSSASETELL